MGFTCSETEAWNIARSSSNNSRMWLHKKLHEDTHGNDSSVFAVYGLGQCRLYQKRARSFMTSIEFRKARQELGLSMVQASKKCGVSYRTWQDWETGKRRLPSYAKVFLFYLRHSWFIFCQFCQFCQFCPQFFAFALNLAHGNWFIR